MTKLYENIKVLSIKDELLFRCTERKARWYLDKGLAEVLSESPLSIKLNFVTSGNDAQRKPYYLQEFKNQCVACGHADEKQLNRVYIVPKCYPMPPSIVKNIDHLLMHDRLEMCVHCSGLFDFHRYKEMQRLANEASIPFEGISYVSLADRKVIVTCASALINHGEKMPAERKSELENRVSTVLGFLPPIEDLKHLYQVLSTNRGVDIKSAKLLVDQKIRSVKDFDDFRIRWRKFFMATMQPLHLPKFWNPEFTIAQDFYAGKIR